MFSTQWGYDKNSEFSNVYWCKLGKWHEQHTSAREDGVFANQRITYKVQNAWRYLG